jgi:Ca2+-binding RTX toxin-like protein
MNGRLSLALLGGAGADVMRGGCANDFLDIDSFDTLIDAGGGTNDVIVVMGSIGINLNITTARGEYVIGGTGNDYFYGNAGADIFRVTAKAQFGSLQPCVSALCPGD